LPTARGSVGPFPVTFATGERRLELLEVTHPPPRPEDGASADRRAHYTTLCLGTCTKPLAAGGHEFGLRRPDGKAVLAGTLDLTGPVTLGATYQSHAGRRVLGLPVLIAGIGGGIGLFTAASEATTSTAEGGEFAGGAVLVAVGIAGAYLLMTKGDEGHVFVAPLSAAAPLTPGAPAALPTAQGASLGLRF
jgi:hypothetical protein